MKNVKVVHTKETVMMSKNFTEAINPTERHSKSTHHTCRKTSTPTCKSSESQEAIILKSQVCIGAPPRIQHIPLEHPHINGVNASDLY